MLALMRYGAGLPLYRMDKWQTHFGLPLPASTQWELIEAASATPALVYDALNGIAAQGRLLHHDDTTMRVQSLRQQLTRMLHKPVEQMGGRGVRKLENSELYDNQLRRPEPNRL